MTRALFLAVVLAAACGKPSSGTQAASDSGLQAPVTAASSAAPEAGSPKPGALSSWRGTYKSAAASLAVPPDFAKTWAHTDPGGGTGDGTMTLTVDGATGRATGTLEGPLGPALVAGDVAGGTLTGAVSRKDPSDRGFTGTLRATVTGDRIDGAMTLASANGAVQRSATVTLTPATP
ncbi:MAG TPA: hypothetical protein VF765_17010 [Polyangiaceae bacterium]